LKDWSHCVESLCHPATGEDLKWNEGSLTDQNNTPFPTTSEIPWLYENPHAALGEWKVRYDNQDAKLVQEIDRIKGNLRDANLPEMAKKRTDRFLRAKVENQKALRKVMEPLKVQYTENANLHDAIKTKLPSTQVLMSYYPNIFRDWVWGEKENEACLAMVSEVIGSHSLGKTAVLGAGACRLPYDVHQKFQPDYSLFIDINPFLFFVAERLLSGKSCQLQEFPMAPLSQESVAVEHKIKGVKDKPENLFFIFADALNPPIKKHSVDTVFTPWFIDIVPMDLADQMKLFNSLVPVGGSWVNFGSLAFTHADIKKTYSRDELWELLDIHGWELVEKVEREIPYLDSPYSAQTRMENTVAFRAKKTKDVEAPGQYHFLPDWLRKDDVPIPAVPQLQDLVFINFLFAELLTGVGQGSGETLTDLRKRLAPKLNLPEDQAGEVLRNVLIRVYEEKLHNLY